MLEDGVKFHLENQAGDGGFPGTVKVDVFYRLNSKINSLLVEYIASTDEDTPLDLTNHAYFNLAGEETNTKIYNHSVKIFSDYTLDLNPDQVLVTGKINSVNQTKYDFRNYTRLGDRINYEGKWPMDGFDNYFISNQQSGSRIIASY
jgi:aldose 1-epimerase